MGKCGVEMGIVSEGRVVLVTGGNRGIGLACARAFEELGDRVAVTYRSKPVDDLFSIQCDVQSTEQVDAAFTQIEERWGPVEVLVANAGITHDTLMMRMDDDAWQSVIDTNLSGAFRVARRATPGMMKAKGGRMIFISSIVGYFGGPGQVNYASSKAGLIGLARSIARELGSRNITANVVTPGAVETDMLAQLNDQQRARFADNVPLGRVAQPVEVAAAVRFLASAEAAYITGAVIPVDGGLAMGG